MLPFPQFTSQPFTVSLPNGSLIHSQSSIDIPVAHNIDPIRAHVFDDNLLHASLLSLSDYANRGCDINLNAHGLTISRDGLLIAHSYKSPTDKLWHVPINTSISSGEAHTVIRHQLQAERVSFYHAAFGSPPIPTFIHALHNNYIRGIPDLTSAVVRANPPHTPITALGHLNMQRQGIRSTQPIPTPPETPITILKETDILISPPLDHHRFYSDATGKMPSPSRHGHQYILVSVHNNYIHAEPLLSRSATNYVKAYTNILAFYKDHLSTFPTVHIMDNETSAEAEQLFTEHHVTVQRVPPHDHRANRAESAIRDFKNHFISISALCPDSMPTNLWDEWLPQCLFTLNTLRPFGSNPSISAYHGLHGNPLDFSAHPIAPIGTKVIIHDPPNIRASWAEHGQHAFYLGPDLRSYRTWRVFVPGTNRCRSSNSLAWFPIPYTLPGASTSEFISRALNDLTMAVHALAPHLPADQMPLVSTVSQLRQQLSSYYPTPLAPLPPIAQNARPDLPYQYDYSPPPTPPHDQRVDEQRVDEQRVDEQRVDGQRMEQPSVQNQLLEHQPVALTALSPDNIPSHHHYISHDNPSGCLAASVLVPQRLTPPPGLPHPPQPSSRTLNLTEDGRLLTYQRAKSGPDAHKWSAAETTELRKLIKDYECMKPIHKSDQPLHRRRDTSYYNPQVKEKLLKDGTIEHRVRGTYGGNIQHSSLPLSAHVAEMEVVKALLHSIASDRAQHKYANFAHFDIKDFYLAAPLPQPEYIRLTKAQLPPEILKEFDLYKYRDDKGSILFEISKSLYGLRQAGRVSQDRLLAHLAKHGYSQHPHVPCLFTHNKRNIMFTLVVDDFGIKYFNKADAEHLYTTLTKLYPVKTDYNATTYLGFHIAFDDTAHTVSLSMPGYVDKLLERHADIIPSRTRSTPEDYIPINYHDHTPATRDPLPDSSPPLSEPDIKRLQSIIGSLLYYARAVDPTILHAVNHAASLQAQPTQAVLNRAIRILQYLKRYPNNHLTYQACQMILHGMSDCSYLSRNNSRSVGGGYAYLGNTNPTDILNSPLLAISSVLPTIVASVAEGEYAAAYLLTQQAVWLRTVLIALGYPQPTTSILCDNQCATDIAMKNVKLRRAKAISMRYHWLQDQVVMGNFKFIWIQGTVNVSDIFTKALPKARFIELASLLVTSPDPINISHLSPHTNRTISRSLSSLNQVSQEGVVKSDLHVLRSRLTDTSCNSVLSYRDALCSLPQRSK